MPCRHSNHGPDNDPERAWAQNQYEHHEHDPAQSQGNPRGGIVYPSSDWVRQCERLTDLDRKLPAVLAGEVQPADAAEQVELATLCEHYKRLYAASVRLFTDAFAADPKLAAVSRQENRYNAACAAALAAARQGGDAKNLPDKVALTLRRQALAWLRADVDAYAKLDESDNAAAKQTVRQRLEHWQEDADLAGLREPDSISSCRPRSRRRAGSYGPTWPLCWSGPNRSRISRDSSRRTVHAAGGHRPRGVPTGLN
jgi:hypothetical protein